MLKPWTRIFFDAPDDGGSGAPAADPAPAAEAAPVTDPAPPPADPAPVAEAAPETEAPDWGARVTEWGGEDEIQAAIELQKALGTQEGVKALFEEAGAALKMDPAKIAELLGGPAPEATTDPIKALLGDDPDRLLSAGEVGELLEQVLEQQIRQPQAQAQQQAWEQTVRNNVQTAFTQVLGEDYDEDVAVAVQALADRYITDEGLADPQKVLEAVRRGKAAYDAAITKSHGEYLKEKKAAHESLPTPLTGGFSPGSEQVEEPQNMEEASARARKRIAAAISNGSPA